MKRFLSTLGLLLSMAALAQTPVPPPGPYVISTLGRGASGDTYPIVAQNQQQYSGTTVLAGNIDVAYFNATGGNITQPLPALASVYDTYTITIVKSDSSTHSVTVTPAGSDNFDFPETQFVLSSQGESVVLKATLATGKWSVAGGTSSYSILNDSTLIGGTTVADALNAMWNGPAFTGAPTTPTPPCNSPSNSTAILNVAYLACVNYMSAVSAFTAICNNQLTTVQTLVIVPAHTGTCTIELPAASAMGNTPVTIYDPAGTINGTNTLVVDTAGGDTILIPTGGGAPATTTSLTFSTPLDLVTFVAYQGGASPQWASLQCDSQQGCMPPLPRPPWLGGSILRSSGCGGGAVNSNNGSLAFQVTMGNAGGSTCVLQLPHAANGYACEASDITNNTSVDIAQSAESIGGTVLETFTGYTRGSSSPIGSWTSGDVVKGSCHAN